ncbi:MAG: hypothetical protein PHD02_01355 [Bacilli bacterium]|nr:hypothetical protein [Bacilli bacterium]
MKEDQNLENLNPLSDSYTPVDTSNESMENISVEPVAPVEPTQSVPVEPVAPVEPTQSVPVEPVAPVEPVESVPVEPVAPIEPTIQPVQEEVIEGPEVVSMDEAKDKPEVVTEQVIGTTQKQKNKSKSSLILIIFILLLLALAVIFMPQISELLK